MIMLSLCNLAFSAQKSDYILGEGQKDKKRLDIQNELFKNKLVKAFEDTNSIKRLDGLTVVDFGCGVASAYPVIKKFIGHSGKYIGIDSSESQITTAQKSYIDAHFIQGDETDSHVLEQISSANVIFMRFVIMHQKKQQDFIKKIYTHMQSGAILIIQEPESTTERKNKMCQKYPYSEIICDFKDILGKGLGLNYNFAGQLAPVLESFQPTKITHRVDDLYATTTQAKELHKENIKNVSKKALSKKIFTKDYINEYMNAVEKLPSDDKKYWLLDSLHTFVVSK